MECSAHENVETQIAETRKEVVGRWWSGELVTTRIEAFIMKGQGKRHNKVGNPTHEKQPSIWLGFSKHEDGVNPSSWC